MSLLTGNKKFRLYGFKVEYCYQVNAKLGTVPMLLWVDRDTARRIRTGKLAVDDRITFARSPLGRIEPGIVTKLEPVLFITAH
jgi:hypothetical protein